MATSSQEYEVVWNGAMEVEARRTAREQLTAPPPRLRHDHTDAHLLVLEYIAGHPGATMRQIQTATCLSGYAVNQSLWVLEQRGVLTRSHAQRDDRSRPVQWTVVR